MKKIRWIIKVIFLIILYIILMQANEADALTQTLSPDVNGIDEAVYPGIKQLINNLQKQNPNWNFKILYTDLDWNEVIANEYTGHGSSPKNLVSGSNKKYSGDWICSICGPTKTYDNGSWNCASEAAVKYMMDPRNSINASDVFQFMELSYNECSYDSIKSMVIGTFLDNELYINTIIEAGKTNNVNPYYIVARILQEQGRSGSSTISGTYAGHEGYYNIFNFNATGNTKSEILSNALSYAKRQEWTSIELSIKGGVAKIASGYIAKGQNTLYFQKFDVENSDGNIYWHQYMQNILAAQSEGETLRKEFNSIGMLNESYTFIIPVYNNMPASACTRPSTISIPIDTPANNPTITTDLVKVNVNSTIALRDAPNGNKLRGVCLNKDEIVTRLEKATSKVNGTYWDKVIKLDGTTGYVARETYETESTYKLYLVPINTGNNNSSENNNNTSKPTTPIENNNGSTEIEENKYDLGDCNGDETINTGDYLIVKKHILGKWTQTDEKIINSMDVNKDGIINTGDLLILKKHILGKQLIVNN